MPDDILTYYARAVQQRLAAQGEPPERIAPVLAEVDAEVRGLFGHERVYIPARGAGRSARDLAIASEYASGHGVHRLATRYELSEKQIRRILAANRAVSHYHAAP